MKKAMLVFTVALLTALTVTAAVLQRQQQTFSEKLIRLHVVANSDSETDQQIKLQVRDAVLPVTENLKLTDVTALLPEIQLAAENCLRELGSEDAVRVTYGMERFPTRFYENFALPAGVYRSIRVTIGAGEGHNWWCVAFPSICLRAAADELEEAAVAAGFSAEEVRLITGDGQGYVLKFKFLELLEQLKIRVSDLSR